MERKISINIQEKKCNLRREIGLQVKAQKPINLSEAQNYALEIEMCLKEAQPTIKLQSSFGPPISPTKCLKKDNSLQDQTTLNKFQQD